jgi:hypothetical protein
MRRVGAIAPIAAIRRAVPIGEIGQTFFRRQVSRDKIDKTGQPR